MFIIPIRRRRSLLVPVNCWFGLVSHHYPYQTHLDSIIPSSNLQSPISNLQSPISNHVVPLALVFTTNDGASHVSMHRSSTFLPTVSVMHRRLLSLMGCSHTRRQVTDGHLRTRAASCSEPPRHRWTATSIGILRRQPRLRVEAPTERARRFVCYGFPTAL
jgi:hypothetical protein